MITHSSPAARLLDPAAQQPADLGNHLAHVLVLPGRQPFPLVDQPQIEPQLVQVRVRVLGVLANEYDMVYFPGDDPSTGSGQGLLSAFRPRGLPIGNLTSQFWSDVYMNGLDWRVVKTLDCRAYLRYVDDFALFCDSKRQLWDWKHAAIDFLASRRLTVHEHAAQVQPVAQGIPWLGFVVYPTHRLLKRRNTVNFVRRLQHNLDLFEAGQITFAELNASVQGWLNHVRYGDTWGLRNAVFKQMAVRYPRKNTGPKS